MSFTETDERSGQIEDATASMLDDLSRRDFLRLGLIGAGSAMALGAAWGERFALGNVVGEVLDENFKYLAEYRTTGLVLPTEALVLPSERSVVTAFKPKFNENGVQLESKKGDVTFGYCGEALLTFSTTEQATCGLFLDKDAEMLLALSANNVWRMLDLRDQQMYRLEEDSLLGWEDYHQAKFYEPKMVLRLRGGYELMDRLKLQPYSVILPNARAGEYSLKVLPRERFTNDIVSLFDPDGVKKYYLSPEGYLHDIDHFKGEVYKTVCVALEMYRHLQIGSKSPVLHPPSSIGTDWRYQADISEPITEENFSRILFQVMIQSGYLTEAITQRALTESVVEPLRKLGERGDLSPEDLFSNALGVAYAVRYLRYGTVKKLYDFVGSKIDWSQLMTIDRAIYPYGYNLSIAMVKAYFDEYGFDPQVPEKDIIGLPLGVFPMVPVSVKDDAPPFRIPEFTYDWWKPSSEMVFTKAPIFRTNISKLLAKTT